jgi:oxepin-CoA hydrolase/3-oxo-5,6-dehydrosuberyl-CoA semialdehyde dehydrogenase
VEAFGPVSTLMPYTDIDDAVALTKLGKGSLCASIATYDDKVAQQFVWGAASHHGRMLVLNRDMAKENTGHGSPLATLVHGGPGRAGGGEEMGGKRGVLHYLQRTAIQGTPAPSPRSPSNTSRAPSNTSPRSTPSACTSKSCRWAIP